MQWRVRHVVCVLPLDCTEERRGIIICSMMRTKIGEVLGHLEAPSWWINEELLKEVTCKLRMGE